MTLPLVAFSHNPHAGAEIDHSLYRLGFLQITDSGIDADLLDAVFCAFFALVLHAALRTGAADEKPALPGTARLAAKDPAWRAVAVIAMGITFVTFSGLGFAFMVAVARHLGMDYHAASSAIGIVLLISAIGCFLGGWAAARLGPSWPLLGAFVLCGAGWHVALHAQDTVTFFAGLVPAIFALQFCFPILLMLAGSIDSDGHMAAIGAPLIVSGFAWAAVLAGVIVRYGGVGALSAATNVGMVLCTGLLLISTCPAPRKDELLFELHNTAMPASE